MNQAQGLSALRWLLSIAGSYVLASGKIDGVLWEQISTVLLTVAPVVWSMFVHTDKAKVQAAAAVPGIAPIQVTPAAADDLQTLARDPAVPSVETAIPTFNPQRKPA
jgi:hypothetical protein